MQTAPKTHLLSGLTTMLSVQVAAFVVFHLSAGLIFQVEFVRLILAYEWPRYIYTGSHLLALYIPTLIFLRMLAQSRFSKPLLLLMIVGTSYYAYRWHYPILTAFLFEIGQFDRHGIFVFENMPDMPEYPGAQSTSTVTE